MADVQIHDDSVSTAPKEYVVPSSAEFTLKCVDATWDGSGAAGAFLPCVEIVSDSGRIVARGMASSVAAGSSAQVSFFPFNRAAATGGAGIQYGVDNDGTWLSVQVENAGTPGGFGFEVIDPHDNGVQMTTNAFSVTDGNAGNFEISGQTDQFDIRANTFTATAAAGPFYVKGVKDFAGLRVGFFNTTPVLQPAHPVTLADVINALTALGLTA